ncbi:MAG: hypothetical protein MSC31_16695 [Solirubrobacteraceae bacterium MAG38_C4-C5]|nr:hypothetical protein [Candidatus Siliceabacter maunaloa]
MADRSPKEAPVADDHVDPTTALTRAAEERRRARVAQLASGWFPTLDRDTLDAICERAWEETHHDAAHGRRAGESSAALAAAAVRRHGLRALRGEPPLVRRERAEAGGEPPSSRRRGSWRGQGGATRER